MKVLIGAAAAAVLLCGVATAQEATPPPAAATVQVPPSHCGELPAAPALADGAGASADNMQVAMAAFTSWEAAYRGVLECRRAEAQEAQATSERRTAEFNGGVTSFNATIASWTAEVEEFNGRQNRRGPRR